ncbi:MAG: DUF3596 domain-containing protein [Desulfobacteraceae bacterium]|nr:DUF3596 domain-containing protein [Desulfobacteraceae bacterium]
MKETKKHNGVRQKSKSSIEIDFYYRGIRCREAIRCKPTVPNLNISAKLKARIEHEISTGDFNYSSHFPNSPRLKLFDNENKSNILIKDYLDAWLKVTKDYLAPSTFDGYRKIVNNRLIPTFGHIPLSDFKRTHAKDWRNTLDISPKTIGNIISPLRIALDEAVDDEIIEVNPLAGWKIKRKKGIFIQQNDDDIDPFSMEERLAILDASEGQAHNLISFWFWTGLRTSELVALQWTDIDFVNGMISINKAKAQVAKAHHETKTTAGKRLIKLLPESLKALKQQKQYTFLSGNEIFQNPQTNMAWIGDQAIRKTMWQHVLRKAGVRYRYPYQCRHTYATMLLMAGESPMWVATQIGHKDWSFTVKTYSRYIPDDNPTAGDKAAGKWSSYGHKGSISA